MCLNKTGMITIEVLISLMILFMVIAVSVTTIKQLNFVMIQQKKYQNIYAAVFNIKDSIAEDICEKKMKLNNKMGGYDYSAVCEHITSLRNYKKSIDDVNSGGNIGKMMIQLYRIRLILKQDRYTKEFVYYKTVTKKVL